MRCSLGGTLTLFVLAAASNVTAQSAHLAALEGSAPPSAVEPLTGGFGVGLAGVFSDPTIAPRATGALFSVYHSTYGSVQLYHGVAAFRAGPRWSVQYAATEIRDLFDTSLTNIDPTLAGLRARAMVVGLDATMPLGRWLTVSGGIGSAADDNVGERQTATVTRLHARVSISPNAHGAIHWTRATGALGDPVGRLQADVGVRKRFGRVTGALNFAVLHGGLWNYSEVSSGASAGAHISIDSTLDLRVGAGRYTVGFGAERHEWRQSASIGVMLRDFRMAACYTGTELGLGSGYGISFGYEPR